MKIKIRFLINTLAGGGAEKVLVDLLNQLNPEYYDLSLLTIAGGVHLSNVPEYVSVRVLAGRKRQKKFIQKVIGKLPAKLFAMLFLRGKYDIEIAYLEGKPTRFLAAKRMKQGARCAFVHCDLSVNNMIAPLYRNVDECITEYKLFSKVCFVSEKSKEGFETAFGMLDNSCIIHNVVDFDRIRALANEPNEAEYKTDGWKLVTVGRLAAPKAYDRLIRIISELEKKYKLELWILGEGEERAQLESMIEELGVKSVRLLGYQENPYSFVRKADLFVCSSLSEGYSTAVTEAVALGVPVITTECAGMVEILRSGRYGDIVENSEDGLKKGLIRFFEDKQRAEAFKRSIQQRDDEEKTGGALEEYNTLFCGMKS